MNNSKPATIQRKFTILSASVWRTVAGLALLLALVVGEAGRSLAADGTWNVNNGGNWSSTNNWTPAAVPGTGADDVVSLTKNITAARTITNDCAVTVGRLYIGDSASTYSAYTLKSGGGTLTFAVSSGNALLSKVYGTANDSISQPITLNSPLIVSNIANGILSLSAIGGTGDLTLKTPAEQITVSGAITNNGNLTLKNETSTNDQVSITGLVNNYGYITNSGNGSARARISGVISNNVQGLVQNGSSKLFLTGINGSFAGGVTIMRGTLEGGDNGGGNTYPWFGTGTITLAGGSESNNTTLSCSGSANSGTFANNITVAADNPGIAKISQSCSSDPRTFSGTVTLNSHDLSWVTANGGALTISGNTSGTGNLDLYAQNSAITMSGSANPVGAITIRGDSSALVTLSGVISSNVTAVTNSGSSVIALMSGAHTYPGNTTLNSGTLRLGRSSIGSTNAITSGPLGKGTLIINGGEISSDGSTARQILNPVVLNGNLTIAQTKTGNLTFSNTVAMGSATRTLTVTSNTTIFASNVSGSDGLTKAGTGMLRILAPASYSGATMINAGTLLLTNNATLASTSVTIASNAQLRLYANNFLPTAAALSANGPSTASQAFYLRYSGTQTVAMLTLNGVAQSAGTYGSTASGAANTNNDWFAPSGSGVIKVTSSDSSTGAIIISR